MTISNETINLSGKKILIIMPDFYTYQEQVRRNLTERGAEVYIYNEEPPKMQYLILKNLGDAIHRDLFGAFNKSLKRRIIREVPEVDYFLTIRGQILTPETIETIKKACLKDGGRTVYYSWDPLKFLRNEGSIASCFEHHFTYDLADSRKYDSFELLPLFYEDAYRAEGASSAAGDKPYDFSCIMSFSEFRYERVRRIIAANPEARIYCKLYLNESVYEAKKVKEGDYYRNLDMDLISLKPFSAEEIRKASDLAYAVLDVTHNGATGLTMRTMECLGLKKKFVTNNPTISEYDFYQADNIYLMPEMDQTTVGIHTSHDKEESKLSGQALLQDLTEEEVASLRLPDAAWLRKPYEISDEIWAKYSLKSWLDTLLGIS